MISRIERRIPAMVVALGMVMSGCRAAPDGPTVGASAANQPVSGRVTLEGSSTVFPVSNRLADQFQRRHAGVSVAVASTSTADGFTKFCAGQLDIAPVRSTPRRSGPATPAALNSSSCRSPSIAWQ
jgi:ABC-type phosphate transport system substrate-binding protein